VVVSAKLFRFWSHKNDALSWCAGNRSEQILEPHYRDGKGIQHPAALFDVFEGAVPVNYRKLRPVATEALIETLQ